MTIQDKIREGIEDRVRLGAIQKETPLLTASVILKFLEENGVVLELPTGADLTGCRTTRIERLIEDV